MPGRFRLAVAALGLAAGLSFDARADIPLQMQPAQGSRADDPRAIAYEGFLVQQKATLGPARIVLSDEATLDLPAGYAFLPPETARALMKKYGNTADENFLGIVMSASPDIWMATVQYVPSGYVKDDDAKTWDTDQMLQQIKDGTEKENEERQLMHVPQLDILGWVEKPHYEAGTHRLVWSIAVRDRGTTDTARNTVNYRTFVLGREGYISLDLVTRQSAIDSEKPIANLLLSHTQFNAGKRYENFNASTDRVAAFGIAALVGGVALKKLGLLALGAAFIAKFIKAIGLAIAGGVAAVTRIFRSKKTAAASDMRAPVAPGAAAAPAQSPADPPQAG